MLSFLVFSLSLSVCLCSGSRNGPSPLALLRPLRDRFMQRLTQSGLPGGVDSTEDSKYNAEQGLPRWLLPLHECAHDRAADRVNHLGTYTSEMAVLAH